MIIIMRMVLFSFVVEPASSGGGDGNDGNKKKASEIFADCVQCTQSNNSTRSTYKERIKMENKKKQMRKKQTQLAKQHGNNAEKITADYIVVQYGMQSGFC